MKKKIMRHGDVVIYVIDKLPENANVSDKSDHVLLEGEVTGHAHRLMVDRPGVVQYHDMSDELVNRGGVLYLTVKEPVEITHEEHGTKIINPGVMEVWRQREASLEDDKEYQLIRD